MAYERHPQAEERRRSAIAAIKAILPLPLFEQHRRKFLSVALWMLTEADGKYNTQYQSAKSIGEPKKLLRHEHVYPRKQMINALIASPTNVDEIAATAIGCVVTKEEHRDLHFENDFEGWDRYKQAGILVIDMETGDEADIDELIAKFSALHLGLLKV